MSFITPDDLRTFLVLSERNDAQAVVLDGICRATHAKMLSYTGRTSLALNPERGSSGVGSLNTLTDSSKAWTASAYVGQVLIDSAGTVFLISASGATTVTVSGTPASGAYFIYPYLTERYEPRFLDGEYLRLRSFPVKGILTIYEDDTTTDTLTANDDYHSMTATGNLHRYGGWKGPEFYWTIKYVGGYIADDADWVHLRHAQLTLADAAFNDSGYKRFIVDQFGNAKGSINFDPLNGSIYESICMAHLSQYRRITL